jgi:hypothetical protein
MGVERHCLANREHNVITFAIEPIADVWDEMTQDWINNWGQEYEEKGETPNLKLERYVEYEKAGWYLQFVARDNNKTVGYCGIYLTPSMHSQKLIAKEDIMYIKKEYRGGTTAIRFFNYIENNVKSRGAISISASVAPNSPASRLLDFLKYKVVQHNYEKRLT